MLHRLLGVSRCLILDGIGVVAPHLRHIEVKANIVSCAVLPEYLAVIVVHGVQNGNGFPQASAGPRHVPLDQCPSEGRGFRLRSPYWMSRRKPSP